MSVDEDEDSTRDIIDDSPQSVTSEDHYRAVGDGEFLERGSRVSYRGEEPKKKRARTMPRELRPLIPLGLYCDYKKIMPWTKHVPRISHMVAPYSLYSSLNMPDKVTLAEGCDNVFFDPEGREWMNDGSKQAEFARRFASYGASTSGSTEPLRPIGRMIPVCDDDPMHVWHTSPVAEVIATHNIVEKRDSLDVQPVPDVTDEVVCKGDFVTESKLRGCTMGGLPGLPSVDLFVFEEATSIVEVSNNILSLHRFWNYGASRPIQLPTSIPVVETEVSEFFTDGYSKTARVMVDTFARDRELDELAMLEHVHPDIKNQLRELKVESCRAPPKLKAVDGQHQFKHSLFDCQIMILPNRVRDSAGKTRWVVCSLLRIRSRVPGCDPILALRCLCKVQNFETELNIVAQKMMHLLKIEGCVSADSLFRSTIDGSNLASIGHEANLPLAFFNFLEQQGISSEAQSPFAADWMGQRIDVYDYDEVAMYKEGVRPAIYSRNKYFELCLLHTNNDMKNRLNARLELPTAIVDWRLFFPGLHFRAVPQAFVSETLAAKVSRSDPEGMAFEEYKDEYFDPTYFFFESDRTPLTRGYACMTQATMRSDESTDVLKQKALKSNVEKNNRKEDELQCVHYCSRRLDLYSTFVISKRDPYETMMRRTTPYPTLANLRANFNNMTVVERDYFNLMTTARDHGNSMRREDITNMIVDTAFCLKGHPMHGDLHNICKSSDVLVMHSYLLDTIGSANTKHLHFGAKSPMSTFRKLALFVLDSNRLDDNPPRSDDGETIAQQHLKQHQNSALGLVNDDAQAARRSVLQFNDIGTKIYVVNASLKRWFQVASFSPWAADGGYGYCAQVCDMGNSVRVHIKSKPGEVVFVYWDLKTPGTGADSSWNLWGRLINEFPREFAPTNALKSMFGDAATVQIKQQSNMAWARSYTVTRNSNGYVMEEESEHNENYGKFYAATELGKTENTKEKQQAVWSCIEPAVGQSGVTCRGTKEKMFSTTLNGKAQNLFKTHHLPLLFIASNTISKERPPSVVDGSRIVLVPAGGPDNLGLIEENLAVEQQQPQVELPPTAMSTDDSDLPKMKKLRELTGIEVRQNMSIFYMEFISRVFPLMHRGLDLPREVKGGFGMFVWNETCNYCSWLTTNLRKRTYIAEDKMSRNSSGSLETLIFGKWIRNILQVTIHKILMRTVHRSANDCETQLQFVVDDAIKTYVLVPHSTAVLLSGMQLYLSMVLLSTSVMLVSLMALYYLKLESNCPLHIIALVVRGRVADLTIEEKKIYWKFAAFLYEKLLRALVPTGLMHTSLTTSDLKKMMDGQWNQRVSYSPSVYVCDKYFDAALNPIIESQRLSTAMVLASSFAADQTKDDNACVFWNRAVEGCRVPVPDGNINEKDHLDFQAAHSCPYLYNDVRDSLTSDGTSPSFGVVKALLRLCDMKNKDSRYDFVRRLLQPWADETFESIDDLISALHPNGILAEDWSVPIVKDGKFIKAKMFEWAVKCEFNTNAASGYHPRVGLAVDVLWLVISQALYASEWHKTETERVSIVNTRSIIGSSRALLFLYLHNRIPKAAVPACVNGGVVLSEPMEFPDRQDEAIVIPYRSQIHVDSGIDGAGFLHLYMRKPNHMQIVATQDGPLLMSKKIQFNDRNSSDIGSTVLGHGYVPPFPPESVAHMLPLMPSLIRVFQGMYRQYPAISTCAGSYWTLATRLFGSNGDVETLGIFPVALTQAALEEEIPCFTYRDGFCFVLELDGPNVRLKPVDLNTTAGHGLDDETLCKHSTFTRLPVLDLGHVSFPAEQLSHAMSGGLVLRDGVAGYEPPAMLRGDVPAIGTPIPFAFMPILRFQCLLLLEFKLPESGGDMFQTYQETEASSLVVGVLHTHPNSTKFMRNGWYHVRYFRENMELESEEEYTTFDYIFTAECLLRDGRMVFYTFTEAQFAEFVDYTSDLHRTPNLPNTHVDQRRRLCRQLTASGEPASGKFTLQCHYTVSNAARSDTLGGEDGTRVCIAFRVREGHSKRAPVILYADVPLFDATNKSRLHVLAPDGEIVQNLVW